MLVRWEISHRQIRSFYQLVYSITINSDTYNNFVCVFLQNQSKSMSICILLVGILKPILFKFQCQSYFLRHACVRLCQCLKKEKNFFMVFALIYVSNQAGLGNLRQVLWGWIFICPKILLCSFILHKFTYVLIRTYTSGLDVNSLYINSFAPFASIKSTVRITSDIMLVWPFLYLQFDQHLALIPQI